MLLDFKEAKLRDNISTLSIDQYLHKNECESRDEMRMWTDETLWMMSELNRWCLYSEEILFGRSFSVTSHRCARARSHPVAKLITVTHPNPTHHPAPADDHNLLLSSHNVYWLAIFGHI